MRGLPQIGAVQPAELPWTAGKCQPLLTRVEQLLRHRLSKHAVLPTRQLPSVSHQNHISVRKREKALEEAQAKTELALLVK